MTSPDPPSPPAPDDDEGGDDGEGAQDVNERQVHTSGNGVGDSDDEELIRTESFDYVEDDDNDDDEGYE